MRSEQHGRLLAIRVRSQNSVLVSLPKPLSRDDVLTLTVTYAGRVEASRRTAKWSISRARCRCSDMPQIAAEPRWLLSNRTHWYPQNTVSDYATGVLRLTVPGLVRRVRQR